MIKLAIVSALAIGLLQGTDKRLEAQETPGQLTIQTKDGKVAGICPLERTSVNAQVSGFGARVTVVQTFTNPTNSPIEAVYTFPLPNDAAVDRMRMKIGDRVIEGLIKRRDEARQIYEAAKQNGQAAALLDQERPNIFTQSVANILPNAKISVEISYVQVMKYDAGQFEFSFPMVVGPRFLGNAPDPDKISPPVTPKATRTGTNVDLTVDIDAGVDIREMKSVLHDVKSEVAGSRAHVVLKKKDEIPNRDFVLRYRCATDTIQSAFVSHMDASRGGYFALYFLPPKVPTAAQIAPREVIFVMDQSGSQSGFPIEKSKELTLNLIKTMRPGDTFNVIGFNNVVRSLWPEPRPNTPQNVAEATTFIKAMDANGGTQLREGVVAALQAQNDPHRLRIVLFNTDGYVGDEKLILDEIRRDRDRARMFTFGIGNSVNRYLIDSMSEEGRGKATYVTLAEKADTAVADYANSIQSPVLTDIHVKVDGVEVTETLPSAIPDVFAGQPIVLYGRYGRPGAAKITIEAKLGGEPWSKSMDVSFGSMSNAPAIETLWARRKVDDLGRQNYMCQVEGEGKNVNDKITEVALEYGIMSQFTSFVAVEPKVINVGGKQRTVRVPVERVDGLSETLYDDESGSLGGLARGTVIAGNSRAFGAGGFGGGGGGVKQAQVPAPRPTSANSKLYFRRDGAAKEKDLVAATKQNIQTKIAKNLKGAKGKVAVQVMLSDLSPATLKALSEAGLKIEHKDVNLRVVFGTIEAKFIEKIAQNANVQRIEKLE